MKTSPHHNGLICRDTHLPYNPNLKLRTRQLRKKMTQAEVKMWFEILQNRNLQGYKFLRQKPIDHFIVDFYCSRLLLAIEVDEASHDGNDKYDAHRTSILNAYGVKVVRFTNNEVLTYTKSF